MCWENAAAKRAWFDSTAIALGKLPTLTEYAIHVFLPHSLSSIQSVSCEMLGGLAEQC
jgi:hypothetical protein